MAKSREKGRSPRKVLRIPDLEHSKHAVVNSLPAKASQESYEYAIDEFIFWHCSEPRLAFSRTVVLRYRFFLEQKNLAPSTINVRLAAVRRLACEALDSGLLGPEPATGIARVKGAKRLGLVIGRQPIKGKPFSRAHARRLWAGKGIMQSWLCFSGAGFVAIRIEDLQFREEHWVIVDLVGKGRHVRTVPMPGWVKDTVDEWTAAAGISEGIIFRRINKEGKVWGPGITSKAIWRVVKAAA
jgi:site-specific recombinase XerC